MSTKEVLGTASSQSVMTSNKEVTLFNVTPAQMLVQTRILIISLSIVI